MSELTIKERLARIEQLLEDHIAYSDKQFSNHLSEHRKYTYLAFSSLIGVVITLVLVLIKIQ